jgi:iron complex outermembrane receptor protein
MHKKNLAVLMTAVPIAGIGFSPAAFAQDTFEPIIVTAQKREQSIYDVPVAISAFTPDTIERQGITDLVDIGKFVPNLNVTGFSAGHTASANPFIRGIGLQDHLITTDPGVGVYVDGVYLGRQVGQNWSLANIERVEVLRGPQGTLYGRNSIGGAINIITRQPGDVQEGRVSLTAGSRGRLNGDLWVNIPLSDRAAMSFTGAFQSRDGIGDFINIENAEKEVGEMEDVSARFALKLTPNDRLSLLFAADGNNGDNGLRPYDTLIDELELTNGTYTGALYAAGYRNSDGAPDPYDNATGQADQVEVTNKAYGVSLTVGVKLSDTANMKLLASDRHSEYESGLDDDHLFDDFLSFPEVGSADQQSVELQFSGTSGRADYVVGLYHFEEEGGNTQSSYTFNGGGGGFFFLGQNMTSQAVYANVGYSVSDAFRIAAGVRHTRDEKTARTILIPDVLDETQSRDWSETSWDLSASYKFSDRMTAYGTVQNGYQSGQFPPRPFCLFGWFFGVPPAPYCFLANDNVTARNYEVGLKGQPLDNLEMSIALFYTDYSDLPYQVSTTSGAGFNTANIIVDQVSQGLEWEGTLVLGDNFRLHSTLGYIDADVKDPNPAAVAPLTPELTFSISPEYTIPTGNGEVTLRADYSYRDEMFGEPSSDPGRFTLIDSRDIVNFDITYRSEAGKWTAGLYGRNVTDERYDNARLNVTDYVLIMLSNDASEFGVRFTKEF